MKPFKLFFAILILLLSAKSFSQVQATTTDGNKVTFDTDRKTWIITANLNNPAKIKGQKPYKTTDIKTVTTSTGEITPGVLRTKYFSTPQAPEIVAIVTTIYGAATCDCNVCIVSPTSCPAGNDCAQRVKVPCGLCCP